MSASRHVASLFGNPAQNHPTACPEHRKRTNICWGNEIISTASFKAFHDRQEGSNERGHDTEETQDSRSLVADVVVKPQKFLSSITPASVVKCRLDDCPCGRAGKSMSEGVSEESLQHLKIDENCSISEGVKLPGKRLSKSFSWKVRSNQHILYSALHRLSPPELVGT